MIDLHVHSRYSHDVIETPSQQVENHVKKGVRVISITDRNCVKGNAEAKTIADKSGIVYIPGIEIDCELKGTIVQVLGHGIDYESRDFDEIDKNADDQEYQASIEMLCKTQALGFHITENDMWNVSKDYYHSGRWTGEMFARVLLGKEQYLNHLLLKPYRLGEIKGNDPCANFSRDFYSPGRLCYVKVAYPSISTAIDIINQNKGKAALLFSKTRNMKKGLEHVSAIGKQSIV
jgi:hypothetical protein